MVAGIKNDGWRKVNVELDDLLRWENAGGQIANRVNEGEAPALQGYSIKRERSPENAGV